MIDAPDTAAATERTAHPVSFAETADTPSLQGRIALITGGSRGLGAAIAQVLGEAGMRVVLADIDLQRAKDRAAILGSSTSRRCRYRWTCPILASARRSWPACIATSASWTC